MTILFVSCASIKLKKIKGKKLKQIKTKVPQIIIVLAEVLDCLSLQGDYVEGFSYTQLSKITAATKQQRVMEKFIEEKEEDLVAQHWRGVKMVHSNGFHTASCDSFVKLWSQFNGL